MCLLKYFRVHKPRDSILSWGSEFNNYEGVINWGGLLLFLGGLRLTLENFNKYGIRVDPNEWFYALFGTIDEFTAEKEYPSLFLILCKYVQILERLSNQVIFRDQGSIMQP